MIRYNGINTVNKVPFLCFINDQDQEIEIPIDLVTANRISKYLSKIALTEAAPPEFDEEDEPEV